MAVFEPENTSRIRVIGLLTMVAGIVSLAVYPYSFFVYVKGIFPNPNPVLDFIETLILPLTVLMAILGAVVFVWGACMFVTGRRRSLTPARGVAAPLMVIVSHVVVAYIPKPSDAVPPADPWSPPATVLDLARRIFVGGYVEPPGPFPIAATLLFVIGIAAARSQPRWEFGVGGAVVVLAGLAGIGLGVYTSVGTLLASLVVGTVPAVIGYKTAAPRAASDSPQNVRDAVASWDPVSVAAVVLLLVGLAAGGWGVNQASTPSYDYTLVADPVAANGTVGPDADRVAYRNLSERQKETFEVAVDATTGIPSRGSLMSNVTDSVVPYHGERYYVRRTPRDSGGGTSEPVLIGEVLSMVLGGTILGISYTRRRSR